MLAQLVSLSVPNLTIACVGLLLSYFLVSTINKKQRIYRKGGHGAAYQTKIPLGVGFVYDAVQSQLQDKDLLFWDRLFRKNANPQRPFTVEVNATGRRLIYTADPDNIKAVLADQFQDYGKGRWLSKEWRALFGHSILATDGQLWKDGRKMIRAQFSKDSISDFATLEEYTQQVVESIVSAESNPVDVSALFLKFTLDHATRFLLGESTDTMKGHEEGIQFGDALDACQRFAMLQAVTGKLGKLMSSAKFYEDLEIVNGFVDSIVERALAITPDEFNQAKSNDEFSFIYSLVDSTKDPVMLRDQLLAVLLAARDTTACCLTWLFHALSHNEEALQDLRNEICSVIGTDRAPTYTELKDMHVLQNTIKETLRLYPSIPMDIRWALKDTSLPRGGGPDGNDPIGILESTPIIYSIQYLHLSEATYANTPADFPDICTFDPKRWQSWHPDHWTYIPFNGGPRLCVGQQFALNEIAYVVVRILQRFERVSWMGKEGPVYTDPTIEGNTPIERFLHAQRIPMHTEIVLAPDGEVNLSFS